MAAQEKRQVFSTAPLTCLHIIHKYIKDLATYVSLDKAYTKQENNTNSVTRQQQILWRLSSKKKGWSKTSHKTSAENNYQSNIINTTISYSKFQL